jgi:DNA transposition AAA+ family ATPase
LPETAGTHLDQNYALLVSNVSELNRFLSAISKLQTHHRPTLVWLGVQLDIFAFVLLEAAEASQELSRADVRVRHRDRFTHHPHNS